MVHRASSVVFFISIVLIGSILVSAQDWPTVLAIQQSHIPACTPCPECKEPGEGTQLVPRSKKVNDHLQAFFVDTPSHPEQFNYRLTLVQGDSSLVRFVIERRQPGQKPNPHILGPRTVFRVNLFDQHGYAHRAFHILNGYGACHVEGTGPPNVEGKLLFNVLTFDK